MKAKFSVAVKILTLFFAALLLVGVTLTVINSIVSRNLLISRLNELEFPSLIENIEGDIDGTIFKPLDALAVIAAGPQLQDWYRSGAQMEGNEDMLLRTMGAVVNQLNGVDSSISSAASLQLMSYSQKEFRPLILEGSDSWYNFLINSNSPISISVYTADYELNPNTVFIDYRILQDGKFVGHISVGLKIDEFIKRVSSRTIGDKGQIYLVDADGIIKISNDQALINKSTLADITGSEELQKEILDSDSDSTTFTSLNGDVQFLHSKVIPLLNWHLVVTADQNEIFAPIRSAIRLSVFITLGIFVVTGIFGVVFLNRMIIRHIVRTKDALVEIAHGDADLTQTLNVATSDELSVLADGFNTFLAKLRSLVTEVKKVIDDTDRIRENISSSSVETSSAVEEISANIGNIKSQMDNLDGNVQGTVSSIEQITSNIQSVDGQISNQAAMVEESTASITEMIASLNNVTQITRTKQEATRALIDVANNGQSQIQETSDLFKEVVKAIDSVQEMATTINDISSQTNLLSMNAAIEAAHAGDAGRGFSVVAEEIRKLAESAADSSVTITDLVQHITSVVNETDNHVNKTAEAFESISSEVRDTVDAFVEIQQSVEELNVGSQQILEATGHINSVTVNVRQGSGEISAGSGGILDSAEKMREISASVHQGMAEVSSGTAEIVASMQQVVNLSQDLTEIVSTLKEQFGQFKS